MSDVDVVNPFYDYISPDLISLFVTNLGGHAPSYIYRLLTENYDQEDNRIDNSNVQRSFNILNSSTPSPILE